MLKKHHKTTAILLPILYAQIFRKPITLIEWWSWMSCSISVENFYLEVINLIELGLIHPIEHQSQIRLYVATEKLMEKLPKHYYLHFGPQLKRVVVNNDRLSLYDRLLQRSVSLKKINEAWPLIKLCHFLPWVRGLAITGSIAVLDPKSSNDDLDFFVVCANNRLWLVRPILVLFSQIFGKRRTWKGEEPNSWCFNMWCEEQSLQLPELNKSYYTAREVFQAWWLLEKNDVGKIFLDSHKWLNGWFVNLGYESMRSGNDSNAKSPDVVANIKIRLNNPLYFDILHILNYALFKTQLFYMKNHHADEFVQKTVALFHKR